MSGIEAVCPRCRWRFRVEPKRVLGYLTHQSRRHKGVGSLRRLKRAVRREMERERR